MAVYSVHLQGEGATGAAEAAFTRTGFEWGAFIYGPFWLLRHRLWLSAAIWTIPLFILIALTSTGILSSGAGAAIGLLLSALFALEAHRLIEARLEERGYHLVEIVAAPNLDQAEAAFYRQFEAPDDDAPAPVEPGSKGRSVAARQDVLGHFPEPGARR